MTLELGAPVLGNNDGLDGILGGGVEAVAVVIIGRSGRGGSRRRRRGVGVDGRGGGDNVRQVANGDAAHALLDGGVEGAFGVGLDGVGRGQFGHGRRDVIGLVEERAGIFAGGDGGGHG